jgi:hypothetical protein
LYSVYTSLIKMGVPDEAMSRIGEVMQKMMMEHPDMAEFMTTGGDPSQMSKE